jgi:hypothetical protein
MKVGAKYPVFCPITTETPGSALVYGTPVVDLEAMAINVNWIRNDIKLYGNDALAGRDNAIMGGTIGFDVAHATDAFKKAALAVVAATSPATYQSITDGISVPGGFGWIEIHLINNVQKYYSKWAYKIAFSLNEDKVAGRQEKREGQGSTVEGDIFGVSIDSTDTIHYVREEPHSTYAAAKAWIDALAGVGLSTVATPTADPAAGAVADEATVTLATATAGATIYYTTDGSTPTTGSMVYSEALVISIAVTIKAIAVKAGMANSAVLSAAYTISA